MTTVVHIGLPLFRISVSTAESGSFLSASASAISSATGGVMTFFRDSPLNGGVEGALAALVEQFESFAGKFAGNEDLEGELHLGGLVGIDGPILRRHGLFIRLVDESERELPFRSESVIVLEVIMALGDQLASLSGNEKLVQAWNDVRMRCDLLPMPRETSFGGPDLETIRAEADWYSSRLWQSSDYYQNAACWLRARQVLSACGKMRMEPTPQEYRLDIVLDLPDEEAISVLVAEAADACDQEMSDFVAGAIMDRNIFARQEVVYRRWYGAPDGRKDSGIPSPLMK